MTARDRADFVNEKRTAHDEAWRGLIGIAADRPERDFTDSDLLPGVNVAAIVDHLARLKVGRNRSQQQRWSKLLSVACGCYGNQLGFISMKSGIRSLAKAMNVSHASLWRDIERLEERGLIRTWKEVQSGNLTTIGLQVIGLTEWLTWLSKARAAALVSIPGAATFRQIKLILTMTIEQQLLLPPSFDSKSSASRVIEELKESANQQHSRYHRPIGRSGQLLTSSAFARN